MPSGYAFTRLSAALASGSSLVAVSSCLAAVMSLVSGNLAADTVRWLLITASLRQ